MSVSVQNALAAKLQNLDPTLVAALLQSVSGNAAVQQPKAAEYVWQPIPKEWETGWNIIRELNSRQYDSEAVVMTAAVEAKGNRPAHPEGVSATWEDGSPITFGDLALVVPEGATNSQGELVNDYPNVWSLTWPEAKGALEYLRKQPKKAKPSSGGRGRGNQQPKAAEPAVSSEAQLLSLLSSLGLINLDVPAKPEPAVGHRKAATPVPAKPEPELVELAVDQIVAFGDELWQVTVHANGRPALRKTIV